MSPTEVVLVSNALGLGGTEKALVEFATTLDRERFSPRVVAVGEGGPRQAQLEASGVPVDVAGGDEQRLADLLSGAEVVHVFRAGNAEPIVPAAARRAGAGPLVELNIFGNVDRSPDREGFAAHMFMSKMTLLRYRDRLGSSAPRDFHARHRALAAPIGFEDLQVRAPEPADARRLLGLDPDRPTVGRVGRAADLKWRNLLVDMVPFLVDLVPDVQVLFVGATPAKVKRLERLGVIDRCVLHDPVLDPDRLAAFYAACDVFVSAAEIGESQGMAINEAMALGVPVVTSSTPWTDNAQAEFVDHGRTGWLAGHPKSFAEACADLLNDRARLAQFGAAARADMESQLSRDVLTRRLETLYAALVAGGAPPSEWTPDAAAVEAFASEYEARAAAEFRPLTPGERVEARATRARERAVQVAGVVRAGAPATVPAALSNAVARSEERGGWRGPVMQGYLGLHRAAQRAGLHVVRASYDSPIPRPEDLSGTFDHDSPMRGIEWDPERQIAFLEQQLGPLIAEFETTDGPAPEGTFRLGNQTYDSVDAELLYGVVRWARPARFVEMGSGYSTLVAAEAIARNGSGELVCHDPYPSPHVLARPDLVANLQRRSVQDLDESVVRGLDAGDVLFVDTSHTVKQGGDVNRVVLDLLPLVRPGVLVHFHDIFLPRDYSPGHIANAHYWNEQYLLQAFLSGNADWEVVIGAQAVARHAPERLAAVIPSFRPGVSPGAFWIRRRG